jgi:hypothetical protein
MVDITIGLGLLCGASALRLLPRLAALEGYRQRGHIAAQRQKAELKTAPTSPIAHSLRWSTQVEQAPSVFSL